VRFTAYGGLIVPGALLRRSTSPAPPFSTDGPSGRSENTLPVTLVQKLALEGEKSQ
jgi:hypothetical protein